MNGQPVQPEEGRTMIGELNQESIFALLTRLHFGHLGVFGDGRVFVFPVSYGYDGDCIYVQSHEGLKVRLMRGHPEVCFEIEEIEGPGRWRTAIFHGMFEELTTEEDRDRAFAVITVATNKGDDQHSLGDYRGLALRRPVVFCATCGVTPWARKVRTHSCVS